MQFQVKQSDAYVKAYRRDVDRLTEELSNEKLRNVKIGVSNHRAVVPLSECFFVRRFLASSMTISALVRLLPMCS